MLTTVAGCTLEAEVVEDFIYAPFEGCSKVYGNRHNLTVERNGLTMNLPHAYMRAALCNWSLPHKSLYILECVCKITCLYHAPSGREERRDEESHFQKHSLETNRDSLLLAKRVAQNDIFGICIQILIVMLPVWLWLYPPEHQKVQPVQAFLFRPQHQRLSPTRRRLDLSLRVEPSYMEAAI